MTTITDKLLQEMYESGISLDDYGMTIGFSNKPNVIGLYQDGDVYCFYQNDEKGIAKYVNQLDAPSAFWKFEDTLFNKFKKQGLFNALIKKRVILMSKSIMVKEFNKHRHEDNVFGFFFPRDSFDKVVPHDDDYEWNLLTHDFKLLNEAKYYILNGNFPYQPDWFGYEVKRVFGLSVQDIYENTDLDVFSSYLFMAKLEEEPEKYASQLFKRLILHQVFTEHKLNIVEISRRFDKVPAKYL